MSTPAISLVTPSTSRTAEIVKDLRELADLLEKGEQKARTVWVIVDTVDGFRQRVLGHNPYLHETLGALEWAKFNFMKKEMRS